MFMTYAGLEMLSPEINIKGGGQECPPRTGLLYGHPPFRKGREMAGQPPGFLSPRKIKNNLNGKGDGQECPPHTGKTLDLLAGFAEGDFDLEFFLAAEDGDVDGVPGAMAVHDMAEVLLVLNILAIDGDD